KSHSSYCNLRSFPTRRSSDLFKSSQLPAETVVIEQERSNHFFRPWSYVLPAVSSFAVIDNKVRKSQQQGETLVEYIRYEFINDRSEEHTSELQSRFDIVCRLL